MDWTQQGARALINDHLDDKIIEKIRARQNIKESQSIKAYNRDLFNNFLNNGARTFVDGESKLRSDGIRPHTGPTRLGSPIYNQRTRILNNIRLFSPRAWPEESDVCEPKIRPHIVQANRNYRLTKQNNSEVVFIANDSNLVNQPSVEAVALKKSPEQTNIARFMRMLDQPQLLSISQNDSKSEHSEGDAPVLSLPTVKLTQYDESGNAEENIPQIETLQTSISQPQLLNVSSRPPVRLSNPSAGSRRAYNFKLTTQHWVDDVSVSSAASKKTPPTNKPRGASVKSKKSKPASNPSQGRVNPEVEPPTIPPPPTAEKNAENSVSEVKLSTVEAEPETPELPLPAFICPSSEEKSRDFAVKLWLATSDFERAPKTVPLI